MAPPKERTSRRRPGVNMPTEDIPLVILLLKSDTPERHEYQAVLSTISSYSVRLRQILQSESIRDHVFLHIDRVVPRLERLFETMKATDLPGDIPENLFHGVVSPLIDSKSEMLSLDQTLRVFGSAIPALLNKPSSFLHNIADALLGVEGLFERLISDGTYSTALKFWLSSKKNYLDNTQIKAITGKLFNMCDTCPGDHDTTSISERWHMTVSLVNSLKSLLKSVQEGELKNLKSGKDLPQLSDMKVLSGDTKKENRTQRSVQPDFYVPDEILQQMTLLGLSKPTSSRALSAVLESLETETQSFMHAALETFPCRPCSEILTGNLAVQTLPSISSGTSVDANKKYSIFGKRVGLWKVLLSDRALKSSRKLARAGTFNRVEATLRQLASGQWKGKDLSNRAGSKKQNRDMRIPVLQAMVTRDLHLLWQIDVGFYDDLPWVRQHIVKVWNIVSQDEVPSAVDQIITLQSSYSSEIVDLSCQRPIQQSDGRFLLRRFDNVHSKVHSDLLPSNTLKTTSQVLIEMSNKYYNLTEPFLKSMAQASGLEEFPFDISPEEMQVVNHFRTSSLILGRSGTGKTTCLVFKILAKYRARKFVPDEPPIRQLLLTRSPFLASKLRAYARSLINTHFPRASKEQGPGELHDEPNSMPTSIFTMEDSSFPFVCTYDDFLSLLDSTIKRADRKTFFPDNNGCPSAKNGEISSGREERVIDFNAFRMEYWGSLSNIVPSCPPELLFSEIMGVIKGSSLSATTLEHLSREEYVSRSSLSPAFATEAERDLVYTAFLRYERLKKQRGELDEVDRVTRLLRILKDSPTLEQLIRQCFEEIYVDEVQDLRCLDIALLLSCVCDARGIHLAGDTAQCISKDSVFRFPEIKALFFDHYNFLGDQTCRPAQFSLAKNYRSHQGILSLASFVMRMLWTGFPDTIDKLDPEIGHTGGPTPMLFAGFDSSILSAKNIGLVKLNDRIGDFGAEQVILVRDEYSKDKLQRQIGDMALILTVLQSKGMEFDDVLIYDFFSGSGLGGSHYRCLTLLARGESKRFDSQKHAALCSELKHLYVAITRARNQLWFVESSENSAKPVLEALREHEGAQLIDTVRQKDHDVASKVSVLRAGQRSVDPERWHKRAAHLLHQKNFADALFCFKKGEDPKGVTQCQAWLYEQQGRVCRASGDLQGLEENYKKAIDMFLEISFIQQAVSCLETLGQYERIGELLKERGELQNAASYFEKGRLFESASQCHHLAGDFEEAANTLRRGDQFEHLIKYISRNQHSLAFSTLHKYSRLCNILLKQGRVPADLRAMTIDLLGSDEDKEAFFKEFEMTDQLGSFYQSKKRYSDLYSLSLLTGDLCTALQLAISPKLENIGADQVETLFNYVVAEEIFARRGWSGKQGERDELLLKAMTSPILEMAASQWKPILSLIDSVDNKEAVIEFSCEEDGLPKDFFCLFTTVFEDQAVSRSKVSSLPIDILWWAVKLLLDLTAEGKSSHELLFLSFGAYDAPPGVSTKTILLPWSPLHRVEDCGMTGLSSEEVIKRAREWVLDKFSDTVSVFNDTALQLCKQEFRSRCVHFLIRGTCTRQRTGECQFTHENADVDHCSSKIAELLKICSVFARLSPLYYRGVMNDEFNGQFLRRKRRWLERLIDEITFTASIDQAAISIHTAKVYLLTNQNFSAVACSLEDLLFHRLGREWEERQSLSMILEQVQLSRVLGFETSTRFCRALVRKVDYNLRKQRIGGDSLSIAFRAVRSAENIRIAAIRNNPYDFCAFVKDFVDAIETSSVKSLSAFEAVASVYEYVATFLLCMISPGDAVVLPWSWAVFHLSGIILARDAKTHGNGVSEQEKMIYGSCLLYAVSGFCKVVDRLEREVRGARGMVFRCAGRYNVPSAIFRRRNADFLATVCLNLIHWPNMGLRGFQDVWMSVQTILSTWTPPGFPNQMNIRTLRGDFLRSFVVYGGKDSVCVISLNDSEDSPFHLKPFVADGAQFVKLSYVLEATHGATDMTGSFKEIKGDKSGEVVEYSDVELRLIVKLQQRWRRVLSRINERRKLRETAEGTVLITLQGLPALSSFSGTRKIAIRAFLFTEGVALILELDKVKRNVQKLRDNFKQVFDNASTSELEELEVIPAQLRHFESKLGGLREWWSLDGVNKSLRQLIAVEEFQLKAREARRILKSVAQDAEIVERKLCD